jgi:CheY-like chemotaxis protein
MMSQILVIDDDARQLRLIDVTLTSAGYQVVVATDSDQAIQAYRSSPADLVIVDLVMPEKNGLEFLAELRQDFPHVPVVMMSAGGMSGAGECLELTTALGAARTLNKPFSRDQLLDVVQEALADSKPR